MFHLGLVVWCVGGTVLRQKWGCLGKCNCIFVSSQEA